MNKIYIPDVFDIFWARRADTFEEYLERLKQLKVSSNAGGTTDHE